MDIPKPFTQLETIDIMLSEGENELTKTIIQERIGQRARLRGIKNDQILAGVQTKIQQLTRGLDEMRELRELVAKEEAAKLESKTKSI